MQDFKLPPLNVINRYINLYNSSLNQHIPFLHLPTLELDLLPIPQLLVMCSIGALYCLETNHARKLHLWACTLVAQDFTRNLSSEQWTSLAQTVLLCLLFAVHTGDADLLRSHLSMHLLLVEVHCQVTTLMKALQSGTRSIAIQSTMWHDWIREEQFRRYFILLLYLFQNILCLFLLFSAAAIITRHSSIAKSIRSSISASLLRGGMVRR
jgi:hypothetical protein